MTRAEFSKRWHALPGNVRGAILVLIGSLGFSGMAVCIKAVGKTVDVWQLVCLRSFIAMLVISPALYRAGPRVMHTRRPLTHISRSILGLGGIVSFFLAITHLELALATTLGFTRVLFVILLAVMFLGERVRWRRTMATLVGFAGVLVCIRPGAEAFDPWTLAALSAALFSAGVSTSIKHLTRTESTVTIMIWSYVVMGLLMLVPTIVLWRTPSPQELGLIALSALFSAWGQAFMVAGLRAGEATVLAPFDYTRLLYAAALGFLLFGEIPANSTWLGGSIIIAATAYIGIREARLSRARTKEQGP